MWGVGTTLLPSSACHKSEEDDPWLFLAATPPRAFIDCSLTHHIVCSEARTEHSSEGRRTDNVPIVFSEQYAEDAALHLKKTSGQISTWDVKEEIEVEAPGRCCGTDEEPASALQTLRPNVGDTTST
ncbi:hypothetical protein HispidOSU_019337 [Sigmodon hispidus]